MVGKTAIKDNSLKSTKFFSENRNYNLKNKLLKEKKIDNSFLEKLRFITLEDLITLKLLVSTEALKGKLYNFPFLKYSSDICKEAVVRFALSISNNRKEASLLMGMKKSDFINYIREYNLLEDFNNESKSRKSGQTMGS
tara:strand:- start:636 stop:1052 length:417 start_codon:yes stop_codon:yes gene_type:complete